MNHQPTGQEAASAAGEVFIFILIVVIALVAVF